MTPTEQTLKAKHSAGFVHLLERGRLVPGTRRSTQVGGAPRASAVASESELAAGFKRLHLSEANARIAARGRETFRDANNLFEGAHRLGLSAAAARVFARGRRGISEAVTKTEPAAGDFKGGSFPSSDFGYVGDAGNPETWALLLTVTPGGDPDPASLRAAVQAIDPTNPASNPVPEEALPKVKATLATAWSKALPDEAVPEILTAEALRAGFKRLGITSESGLRAAMRGRN